MKRSEFGIEDWCKFMPELDHHHIYVADIHNAWEATIGKDRINYYAQDKSLEEAMRKCIEHFCNDKDIPLPWKQDNPDFSAWSREKCEEYIYSQKCLFATKFDALESDVESSYTAIAIRINGFGAYFGSPKIPPTLKDYQNATEWLWEQVNK